MAGHLSASSSFPLPSSTLAKNQDHPLSSYFAQKGRLSTLLPFPEPSFPLKPKIVTQVFVSFSVLLEPTLNHYKSVAFIDRPHKTSWFLMKEKKAEDSLEKRGKAVL